MGISGRSLPFKAYAFYYVRLEIYSASKILRVADYRPARENAKIVFFFCFSKSKYKKTEKFRNFGNYSKTKIMRHLNISLHRVFFLLKRIFS